MAGENYVISDQGMKRAGVNRKNWSSQFFIALI